MPKTLVAQEKWLQKPKHESEPEVEINSGTVAPATVAASALKLQLSSKSLPSAKCYLISQSRLQLPKMDT